MTYIVFHASELAEPDELVMAVAMNLLIPSAKIKAEFWDSHMFLEIGIKRQYPESLLAYLLYWETACHPFIVLKVPCVLTSDDKLISFGEKYLGCIQSGTKADILKKRLPYLERWQGVMDISDFANSFYGEAKNKFSVGNISADDIKGFAEVAQSSVDTFTRWAQQKGTAVKTDYLTAMPALVRDFRCCALLG